MRQPSTPIPSGTKQVPLMLELSAPEGGDRPVYVAGNFNNWDPRDERFRLRPSAEGKFVLIFPEGIFLPTPLEYKYSRGGWENVELDRFANHTPNRVLEDGTGWVFDTVPRWLCDGRDHRPELLPIIEQVGDGFEMYPSGKKRRVWALLPHDYQHFPERRYPVLYLQDAQNLFDEKNPFGNWAIDKKLAVLAENHSHPVIVVAIEHGENDRIHEFLPNEGGKSGKGHGKAYIRFLTDTVKPLVDRCFRTLPDRHHTGIGRRSRGGLISIYAGLMHPETFGRLMVFSPSLWAAPKIYFNAIQFFNPYETKIYLYAGGKESVDMYPNVQRFRSALALQGLDSSRLSFRISFDPMGQHREARWGEEFPKALEWLFGDNRLFLD